MHGVRLVVVDAMPVLRRGRPAHEVSSGHRSTPEGGHVHADLQGFEFGAGDVGHRLSSVRRRRMVRMVRTRSFPSWSAYLASMRTTRSGPDRPSRGTMSRYFAWHATVSPTRA